MAINITVALTDAEQALVQELAAKIAPTATGPEIIAWVQLQCKKGLRKSVIELWAEQAREEANALTVTRLARAETDFPVIP